MATEIVKWQPRRPHFHISYRTSSAFYRVGPLAHLPQYCLYGLGGALEGFRQESSSPTPGDAELNQESFGYTVCALSLRYKHMVDG